MNTIQQFKKLTMGFFLLTSLIANATETFPRAEFGVVKSKSGIVYLSCQKESDSIKKCHVYQQKKGEEAQSISREMILVDLDKKSEAVKGVLYRMSHEEFSALILVPITGLAATLSLLGGPKYIPMFALAPLDIVAGPVALMADGCRRLYRLIQGAYLKKAWKTVTGQTNHGSMKLSRKDFKEFVGAIQRSAI